jgi:hypothetical protein
MNVEGELSGGISGQGEGVKKEYLGVRRTA